MYLRWETPQSALTYGGVTPESQRRSNTYASRTSPMDEMKFEMRSEAETRRLAVYQANVYGDEHVDRFDKLGVTGPYYLMQRPWKRAAFDVWLITESGDPAADDAERVRLTQGLDYTIHAETGVIWLTSAPDRQSSVNFKPASSK